MSHVTVIITIAHFLFVVTALHTVLHASMMYSRISSSFAKRLKIVCFQIGYFSIENVVNVDLDLFQYL